MSEKSRKVVKLVFLILFVLLLLGYYGYKKLTFLEYGIIGEFDENAPTIQRVIDARPEKTIVTFYVPLVEGKEIRVEETDEEIRGYFWCPQKKKIREFYVEKNFPEVQLKITEEDFEKWRKYVIEGGPQ